MSEYLEAAFNRVLADATPAADWYVALVEDIPFYGGPEEGGWWGNDTVVRAVKKFPTEELAQSAVEAVQKLAAELADESKRASDAQCLRECDWCEQRGLDADYLPEPDGPSHFRVLMTQELPENRIGPRHYE